MLPGAYLADKCLAVPRAAPGLNKVFPDDIMVIFLGERFVDSIRVRRYRSFIRV